MSSTASDEVALAETDEESNEISATLDALDNAKRVGEFDHWRAAKLNKRMRKRFAERKAEMEAKIFHEKEMIKKRHHRMQVARKAAWRKERKEAEEILNQQKSLGADHDGLLQNLGVRREAARNGDGLQKYNRGKCMTNCGASTN